MRYSLTNAMPLLHRRLFELEQWIALLLGVVCLGVALWAAFQRGTALSAAHPSRLAKDVLTAVKWFLIVIETLIGLALFRFALYSPNETKAGTEPAVGTSRQKGNHPHSEGRP